MDLLTAQGGVTVVISGHVAPSTGKKKSLHPTQGEKKTAILKPTVTDQ